jgi:ABC-type branched-subunit amino acid transport system substrate-binding protein
LVSLVVATMTAAAVLLLAAVPLPASAGASSASASQGVTATTIRVGIPYIDLSAVRKFGITLDHGNYPDAYDAIIANINAHGGIDGRRLVPFLVAVNPVGTAPAATACTQLAQDDHVFVAIAPFQPDCYLSHYDVPTINGSSQDISTSRSRTPNFTLTPPPLAYDPVQLAVLAHHGVFKGKRVGVFAGLVTDQSELHVVDSTLKKLHVDIVSSAVDSAPTGDQSATNQQAEVIAQRFQASGVNEVVALGSGSEIWPESLQAAQSSYDPPWVATSSGTVNTAVIASSITPTYLKSLVTTSPVLDNYQTWHQAADQRCYQVVRRAYPHDKITPPTEPITGSDQSFFAVEDACDNLALFAAIAQGAGKDLTRERFIKAGYALHDASLPGSGVPVSFAPSRPYPLGPVYIGRYDASKNSVMYSSVSG